MENENTTLPQGEVTQKEVNAGTQPANVDVKPTEVKKEEKTYSEEEFNTNMANTRRATEKETKKKLLAELGLTLEDEEKLAKYKQAYEDSLTEEEKKSAEMQNLQETNAKLSKDLEEKDYIIKALIQLTGKTEEDVEKIVKMAKGLKTEDNTIDDAIKEVLSMVNTKAVTPNVDVTQPTTDPTMPISQPLEQPSVVSVDTTLNPWKKETYNLTLQGQLLRQNPELARKLADEAGVRLK